MWRKVQSKLLRANDTIGGLARLVPRTRKRHLIFGLTFIIIVSTLSLFYEETFYITKIRYDSRQILQAASQDLLHADKSIDDDNENSDDDVVPVDGVDDDVNNRNPENVPNVYFEDSPLKLKYYNKTCATFPTALDLRFNNEYWQVQNTSNGTYQLFNAFLDDRELVGRQGPVLRVIGMLDRVAPTLKIYCQMRFSDVYYTVIMSVEESFHVWYPQWGGYENGVYQPYIFTCRLPQNMRDKVPVSVALVEHPCDKPTNNLKVIYNKPASAKKDFAVCVKGLNFPFEDKTVRLTEWIELLNLLGVDKIFFYEFHVHPNVKKLLNYYTKQGKVYVTPLTLVGPDTANTPYLQNLYLRKRHVERRLQEVIPFNDCLYKNMNQYRYVVILDIDEVIVPPTDTWFELIDQLEKLNNKSATSSCYTAQNVYFLDNVQHDHAWFTPAIPRYMHMLQHVYRARNYTKPGHYIKSFLNTERVMALHNHYPRACLGGRGCTHQPIPVELAHLQHYRNGCVRELDKSCEAMRNSSVMDTRVWNYKEELIERVKITLRDLGVLRRKKKSSA